MNAINYNTNFSGIFKSNMLYDGTVAKIAAFDMTTENIKSIDIDYFEKNKNILPTARFISNEMKNTALTNKVTPCWVTFINKDRTKPLIIGYYGKGIRDIGGGTTDINNGGSRYKYINGEVVDAKFTAYYATTDNWSSEENILEGGPLDAMGNVLNYKNKTCAAPQEIEFDTPITILSIDRSTEYKNEIYTVTDRGGAINILTNVDAQDNSGRHFDKLYCFDLLVKDKTTADAFGVQYGTVMIGGEKVILNDTIITIDGNTVYYNGLIRCMSGTDTGYAGDEGLDISAPMGTPVYSPCDGTFRFSEYGHTPWGISKWGSKKDDTPYSIGIYMNTPVTYAGKTISYVFLTHLSSVVNTIHDGQGGQQVKVGELIGYSGTANSVPHLHIGLSPKSWDPLTMQQTREFFNSSYNLKWEVGK